jgi:hypothetical protein
MREQREGVITICEDGRGDIVAIVAANAELDDVVIDGDESGARNDGGGNVIVRGEASNR